jgi:hypothetical protein
MSRLAIPRGVDELHAEWLDEQLHARGVLKQAHVTGFEVEGLGAGRGFVGTLVRLHLKLDRAEATAPATLVAKFPLRGGTNRALGEASGSYEREIRFYQELASELAIRTPRCYGAVYDAMPFSEYAPVAIRAFELLPAVVLVPTLRALLWLAARSPRRYVLLLEDLAPAEPGDQVRGCGTEAAAQALGALARMQAPLWNSPRLERFPWLSPIDLGARSFHALFREVWLRKGGSEIWPNAARPFGDWLSANAVAIYERLARPPHTLIHGDYRLDNLFFDGQGAGGIAAVDWQVAARGRGAFDAAYFVSGNLAPDVATAHEEELLRGYHAELLRGGVTSYPFEACRLDYARGIALLVHRWVLLEANVIALDHARGDELIERGIERLVARLPEPPWDRLLA